MRVVCDDGRSSLTFERPMRVLRAERLEDVARVLERADLAVESGHHVAGYVTYKAGAAFVPKQRPPTADALPFAEIGVFSAPRARSHTKVDREAGGAPFTIGPLVPTISGRSYEAAIATILSRIRAGDVYQVNLAAPFTFAFSGDARSLFDELLDGGAYPHTAFVESGRYAIVSCSPESFVRFEGDRLVTKPMKGTAQRGDLAQLATAKNRAEHVMIVDLLRNDLHRLANDVAVERLAEVERYPNYATMTSTIVATRSTPFALAQTFAAMFPCGSVTGAPKVTAMQTIAELEDRRGMFCGSIGYRAPDGSGSWNVAIRTAIVDRERGRGTLRVGGGIVADSKARDEWAEILVKRRFLDRLAPTFSLIETMRREDDLRYRNLEDHLARLAESADALHFAFDDRVIRRALAAIRGRNVLVRVRLDADGTVRITTRPFVAQTDATILWAKAIVDASEPLQRYKTTWRPHYDAARDQARHAGAFDAVLCTTEGSVADGARANVFVESAPGEPLRTPPIADGALPGVLRAQLLRSGRAIETRLTRRDVTNAATLYIGNSARGLIRARFLIAP